MVFVTTRVEYEYGKPTAVQIVWGNQTPKIKLRRAMRETDMDWRRWE